MVSSTATVRQSTDALPALRAVAGRHHASLADRLTELQQWLGADLRELEAAVAALEVASGTRARDAGRHILALPGKRLRAICALLAARLVGGENVAAARTVALAVELVHAATLLHDDVIDDSALRRGRPAAHTLFGNSVSILAGDAVLVEALRMTAALPDVRVSRWLLDALSRIVAAEAMQLDMRQWAEPSRQHYLTVAEGKTATLFAWAFAAGAAVAGAGEATCDTVREVGRALGLAFQIVDDVLDLEGDAAVMGKDALADVREGKFTWPLILAAERNETLAPLYRRAAQAGDPQLMGEAVARAVATGAVQQARNDARAHADRAVAALAFLPDTPARARLCDLIDIAVSRAA